MKQQKFIDGKVSIVTPVYNGELHLPHMLDSILNQTYSQIEMILVDDGSTDKTIRVAESYRKKFSDRGYQYHIIYGIHKNASGAINYGLPYVTGEYLIWPDSDDVLEPESVEKRVCFLEENQQYQCVRSLSYYFDWKEGILDKADESIGDLSKEDLFWDILEFKTYVCCGCYMLKSKYFFEIYPKRHIPEYYVGQNFQMLLPFMYYHKCHTIQERLYGVCVREGSHSRTVLTQKEEEKKYRTYEKMVDEIADICKIKDRESRKRIRLWKVKRRYNIAQKYGRIWRMLSALCQLWLCGAEGHKLFKKYGKVLWSYTWLTKKKIWLYWRVRIKLAFILNMCKRFILKGADIMRYLPGGKKIAITFDDGYQYTEQILEKLRKHHVKATFFVCGDWIKNHPKEYKKIYRNGHDIGNHSYSHAHMESLSDEEVYDEIDKVQILSRQIIGKKSKWFRFPYGEHNERLYRLVHKKGLKSVGWSIDSRDWEGINSEEIFKNVIEQKEIRPGEVIIMHTNGASTVEALESIILELKKRGFKLVRISDLMRWPPLNLFLRIKKIVR